MTFDQSSRIASVQAPAKALDSIAASKNRTHPGTVHRIGEEKG
jgi:hypothetical protein